MCSVPVERCGRRGLLHFTVAGRRHQEQQHDRHVGGAARDRVDAVQLDGGRAAALRRLAVAPRRRRGGPGRRQVDARSWRGHGQGARAAAAAGARQAAARQAGRSRRSARDEVALGRVRLARHRDDRHQGRQVPADYIFFAESTN